MSFSIDGMTIGAGTPYVIAEAGTNFRDDVTLAKAFIVEAAEAGADAVKFQTHLQEEEMVEPEMRGLGYGDLYDRIGDYELSVSEHRELKEHCESEGVTFLSTPFSVEAVRLLEDVGVSAYKIGSGELTNKHLTQEATETGKPLIVSTGMSDMQEVRETYGFVSERSPEFCFLHCVSNYPADPGELNLGLIRRMKEMFDVPVGFSDHSTGIEASVIAMCLGADVIEKHFTIDRRLPGGDQEVSIEPDELSDLVRYAELLGETGGDEKELLEGEMEVRRWAEHSVVTKESVEEGEEFTTENLTTKRPGTGIPASSYYDVVGRRASRDIPVNTVLQEEDVEDSIDI